MRIALAIMMTWTVLAVLGLAGCAFGGAKETVTFIMAEPGATLEIFEDKPIRCRAVDAKNTEHIGTRNMAGTVAMPKSVYRLMKRDAEMIAMLKEQKPDAYKALLEAWQATQAP